MDARPSPPPAPDRQLLKIMPCLPLRDVAAGVAHYRDVLGFTINYAQDNLGVMDRDDVRVLLVAKPEQAGTGSCYVYVRAADALHAELLGKGARVLGPPVSHPWGLRDFCVLDLEGNEITFGQPFE
jgi:predicted enzyme related to lactoylglutathione lyase